MAETPGGHYYPEVGDPVDVQADMQLAAEAADDAVIAAQGRPWRSLQKTTSTSVPHNTWTDVTGWVGINSDPGDGSISYSPGALTVSQGGVYKIRAQITFVDGPNDVGLRAVRLIRSGAAIAVGSDIAEIGSLNTRSCEFLGYLPSGAVVTCQAYQGDGVGTSFGYQTAAGYNLWTAVLLVPDLGA